MVPSVSLLFLSLALLFSFPFLTAFQYGGADAAAAFALCFAKQQGGTNWEMDMERKEKKRGEERRDVIFSLLCFFSLSSLPFFLLLFLLQPPLAPSALQRKNDTHEDTNVSVV